MSAGNIAYVSINSVIWSGGSSVQGGPAVQFSAVVLAPDGSAVTTPWEQYLNGAEAVLSYGDSGEDIRQKIISVIQAIGPAQDPPIASPDVSFVTG